MDTSLPAFGASPFEQRGMDTRRIASWVVIAALHIGFFYAFSHGLVQHVSQAVPKVIFAVMLPAEKPAEQPRPEVLPQPKKLTPPVEHVPPPVPVIEPTPTPAVVSGPVPMRESAPQTQPQSMAAAGAPAQSPQAAAPRVISSVEYLQAPRPEYPASSRRRGEEGVVQLRVLINEAGRATQIDIVKSSEWPRLDEAARQAVLRAVFKPYMENGRAMPVFAIVPINFQLG